MEEPDNALKMRPAQYLFDRTGHLFLEKDYSTLSLGQPIFSPAYHNAHCSNGTKLPPALPRRQPSPVPSHNTTSKSKSTLIRNPPSQHHSVAAKKVTKPKAESKEKLPAITKQQSKINNKENRRDSNSQPPKAPSTAKRIANPNPIANSKPKRSPTPESSLHRNSAVEDNETHQNMAVETTVVNDTVHDSGANDNVSEHPYASRFDQRPVSRSSTPQRSPIVAVDVLSIRVPSPVPSLKSNDNASSRGGSRSHSPAAYLPEADAFGDGTFDVPFPIVKKRSRPASSLEPDASFANETEEFAFLSIVAPNQAPEAAEASSNMYLTVSEPEWEVLQPTSEHVAEALQDTSRVGEAMCEPQMSLAVDGPSNDICAEIDIGEFDGRCACDVAPALDAIVLAAVSDDVIARQVAAVRVSSALVHRAMGYVVATFADCRSFVNDIVDSAADKGWYKLNYHDIEIQCDVGPLESVDNLLLDGAASTPLIAVPPQQPRPDRPRRFSGTFSRDGATLHITTPGSVTVEGDFSKGPTQTPDVVVPAWDTSRVAPPLTPVSHRALPRCRRPVAASPVFSPLPRDLESKNATPVRRPGHVSPPVVEQRDDSFMSHGAAWSAMREGRPPPVNAFDARCSPYYSGREMLVADKHVDPEIRLLELRMRARGAL